MFILILIFLVPYAQSAGLTIVTHGLASNTPIWLIRMQNEIALRAEGPFSEVALATMKITDKVNSEFVVSFSWTQLPSLSKSGEVVLLLDWSDVAEGILRKLDQKVEILTGTVAKLAVDSLVKIDFNGSPILNLPIHLVGHSRGASVVSQIALNLGEKGIWVDHLTTLDRQTTQFDPRSRVFENIIYADNYYQKISPPRGAFLTGAYNRELLTLDGGYSAFSSFSPSHSDVHLWYHGTIDTSDDSWDGNEEFCDIDRDLWYNLSGEDRGKKTGIFLSRIASNEWGQSDPRPKSGYHPDHPRGDKDTHRESIPQANPVWPNVMITNVNDGQTSFVTGDTVHIGYIYQDAGSPINIEFYLDTDTNPYNDSSALYSIASLDFPKSLSIENLIFFWFYDSNPIGDCYLMAKASDDTRTRYYYYPKKLNFSAPASPTPTKTNTPVPPTNIPTPTKTPVPPNPSSPTLWVELDSQLGNPGERTIDRRWFTRWAGL